MFFPRKSGLGRFQSRCWESGAWFSQHLRTCVWAARCADCAMAFKSGEFIVDSWTHGVSDVMILWSVKSSTSICLGGVFLSSDGLFGLYHMSQGARNRGVKCFSTHMINDLKTCTTWELGSRGFGFLSDFPTPDFLLGCYRRKRYVCRKFKIYVKLVKITWQLLINYQDKYNSQHVPNTGLFDQFGLYPWNSVNGFPNTIICPFGNPL